MSASPILFSLIVPAFSAAHAPFCLFKYLDISKKQRARAFFALKALLFSACLCYGKDAALLKL